MAMFVDVREMRTTGEVYKMSVKGSRRHGKPKTAVEWHNQSWPLLASLKPKWYKWLSEMEACLNWELGKNPAPDQDMAVKGEHICETLQVHQ